MKNTLVIVAHPNLTGSVVNKTLMERVLQDDNITVHDLYAAYPDGQIDTAYEQQLLLNPDRIVFQFPFYWYSSPALLKEWMDVVLLYGWAYGTEGTQLHGKECGLAISTGGPEAAYQAGGYNNYSISELTKPFQATANLTGMRFLPIFTTHGVRILTDGDIRQSSEAFVSYLKSDF